jgi:hypothetical protein
VALSPTLGRSAPRSARVHNELRSELNSLLDQGQVDQVLDRITLVYLGNRNIFKMLPVRRAMGSISDDEASSIKNILALAIVYDLYLRFIGDDRPHIRNDAYKDFLANKDCERPSQLQLPLDREDPKRVVYFLGYICIPEVMHDSGAFRSSKELIEERLKIRVLLRIYDPESAAQYDTEIRDITPSQIVQQGLLHVERSKFAINTQPLRRWAEKNLKESYLRSRDLTIAGDIDIPASGSEDDGLLKTPVNELTEVSHEALTRFIEEAYTNSFHGLDSYLSMRARHGSFSGHIRAVLGEDRIITSRDARTDEYKPNRISIRRHAIC